MGKKSNILKKNKKKAKKHGYDRHYYIEKLGIPIEKCGTNFCDNTDDRYQDWMKEREKYGFDSRETWALGNHYFAWLYERVKAYKKYASKIVDLKFHKIQIGDKELTQRKAINLMLKKLKKMLLTDYYACDDTEEYINLGREVCDIWKELFPYMWW